MTGDFTKLASYLNSFSEEDPGYDYACYIKNKIADDNAEPAVIGNSEDAELGDTDITTNSGEQRASENLEGDIMGGAFSEFDALNELDRREEEIDMGNQVKGQQDIASTSLDFGNNAGNQKQASAFIKDIEFKDLPPKVKLEVARFIPATPTTAFVHYGLVVRELVPKVDRANFTQAEAHIKKLPAKDLEINTLLNQAKLKYILLLNDKIIDGHHFLAKCKAAGISSSLHVLDLTPARFQKVKKASLLDLIQKQLT